MKRPRTAGRSQRCSSATATLIMKMTMLAMTSLAIAAAPAQAAESSSTAEAEHGLLHLKMDLGAVRRWQSDTLSTEPLVSSKPLLVVHLFSLDCPPCLAELPKLKDVFRSGLTDIDYALVLETLDSTRIREFLKQEAGKLPQVGLYLSTDRRMRGTSQLDLETIPITLLLDEHRVVRQAFVGSLNGRLHLFNAALNRLARALKHQPQPLEFGPADSGPLQGDQLLHRRLARLPTDPADGRAAGRRPGAAASPLQVIYLFGSSCAECIEDLEGKLRRMTQSWNNPGGVRFALLNCSETGAGASSGRGQLPAGLFYPCSDKLLHGLWAKEQRPITLLVDSEQLVRDVFVGSVRSSVGVAIRRMLAAAR